MRKSPISFLMGVVMTLLLVALTTTALAVSGKVTFGFANVALNGETKIVSGENITVANGQKVPGSILYVDEAGGKTNYLPIRAISELLGVDIDYDSESKTVLLMTKTWQKSTDGRYLKYSSRDWDDSNSVNNKSMPLWQPSWIPENLSLVEVWHSTKKNIVRRVYEGQDTRISYSCSASDAGSFIYGMQSKEAVETCQNVSIQGNTADYYVDADNKVLVWENSEGMLFKIVAKNLSEEALFRFAESCVLAVTEVDDCALGWLPSGYTFFDSYATPGTVNERWVKNGVALTWIYSAYPLGEVGESAEKININGEEAWYCEAELPFEDDAGSISVGGDVVDGDSTVVGNTSVSGVTIPGAKRMNSLVWMDVETGTYFKLQSILDKEIMIRIAENAQ